LSIYDLTPPATKYDEGAALRALSRQEDSKLIAADRSVDRTRRPTGLSLPVMLDEVGMPKSIAMNLTFPEQGVVGSRSCVDHSLTPSLF
jgi:hypothetical protein